MDAGPTLQAARMRAGLSQTDLARRTGTSQATISAYENGSKQPSVATFSRLLAATGTRLAVERAPASVVEPSQAEHARGVLQSFRQHELPAEIVTQHPVLPECVGGVGP